MDTVEVLLSYILISTICGLLILLFLRQKPGTKKKDSIQFDLRRKKSFKVGQRHYHKKTFYLVVLAHFYLIILVSLPLVLKTKDFESHTEHTFLLFFFLVVTLLSFVIIKLMRKNYVR